MPETSADVQEQYISHLIKHPELVDDFMDGILDIDHFDNRYRLLIHAVMESVNHGVRLTRRSFMEFVSKFVKSNSDIADQEILFNKISFIISDVNDYPMLKGKVLDRYIRSKTNSFINKFLEDREKNGDIFAVKQLSGSLNDLSLGADEKKKIVYQNIHDLGDEVLANLLGVRSGSIEDDEFISFGFAELDKTTTIGLAPGTLTLFCGDVGGFKSTMMTNVGLNVWTRGHKNVLVVPLEMPRQQVYNKMWSRESQIPFDYISRPRSLSDEQVKHLTDVKDSWKEYEGNICFMDSYEDRTRVSVIRREIEKHIDIFKPDVVVIDYIANLDPDGGYRDRPDLEIGKMLKDLRHMGRAGVMHETGFAIVSGAQIGREGLKRVRKSSNDKMTFYSEDLRGSHEFSADADNIFVLFRDPQQPDERLQCYAMKCRYGKTTFPDGGNKTIFEVRPDISLIRSASDYYNGEDAVDILKKVDDDDLSLNQTDDVDGEQNDADFDPGAVFEEWG
jgi:replicative DNA helicase